MRTPDQRNVCRVAFEKKLISKAALDACLAELNDLPPGSDTECVLLNRGLLTREHLEELLMGQEHVSTPVGPPGPRMAPPERRTAPRLPALEILEEVAPGIGGMGMVYRARDVSLDRIVAVKIAREEMRTAEGRAFFESEARAAAKLDHPNIVKIYSFNPGHEPPYYVMEFVEGRPLDEACRGRTHRFVAEVVEKVARALTYAHSRGIVHRDIKPANILVDHDNEPHVADFGLAKRLDSVARELPTEPGLLKGTPLFIAPEIYAGTGRVNATVDIYALGVTLYLALTGRHPFTGMNRAELSWRIVHEEPKLPIEWMPSTPEPLQRICLKAMEKDPGHRYGSAQAMAEDLRRFLDAREVFARPTRYDKELRGKLHNHATEIEMWQEQRLVSVPEMDRLLRPYRALMSADAAWRSPSNCLPWDTMLLRLSGWILLISSLLWPAFYWGHLTRFERVLSVGLPALALNVAGWLFHVRASRRNAMIFLSTGTWLAMICVLVFLVEYRVLCCRQDPSLELFGDATIGIAERGTFSPTNAQLTAAAAVFTTYCVLVLWRVQANVFAAWTGMGAYLLHSGMLLLFGLRRWLETEHASRALLCYMPLCVLFCALGIFLDRRAAKRFAGVFYVLFPLPFAGILTALARYGSVEWLSARPEAHSEAINLWLMANGALYFIWALWSARAKASFVRFWGDFFMLLVPVSLLYPSNMLWENGQALMTVGREPVTTYELASLLAAIALAALGTRLGRPALFLSGQIGMALFVFRATQSHFLEHRSWPFALALTGAAGMLAGMLLAFLRAKKSAAGIASGP